MTDPPVIRIPQGLVASIDDLIARGRFSTRAELVRRAVADLVEAERRKAVGEAIVEGYRPRPQTAGDLAEATAWATTSIHDEPW